MQNVFDRVSSPAGVFIPLKLFLFYKITVQKNQETDGREVVLPQKEILTDVHLQTGIWIDVIHWTEIWTSALPQKTDSEMKGHHMMTGVMIGSEMTDVPLLMTDLTDVHPQMTVSEKTEDLLVVAGEIEKETETEMGQPLGRLIFSYLLRVCQSQWCVLCCLKTHLVVE